MSAVANVPRAPAAQPSRPLPPPRLLGAGTLIVFATLIPYLCGYLLTPQHRQFLGALNNVGDLSQYLAAIRQGSAGAWLYTNQFTPEHAQPLLMYLPYILGGKLALGLPSTAVFQILRLLSAAACLVALARFCLLFVGAQALRMTWLFVLMAGGLYWLALLLSPLGFHVVDPAQLTAPELSPLVTMLISPHESLGLAAELVGYLCYLKSVGARTSLWTAARPVQVQRERAPSLYLAGAAASFLVLALSYPFLLPTVGLVLVACTTINAFGAGRTRPVTAMRKREMRASGLFIADIRRLVLVLLPAGVIGIYYWQVFRHDPLWSQSRFTLVGSPDFAVLAFAYGPLAVGAWFGARRLAEWRAGGDSIPFAWAGFPVIWAVVNACTLLLPIWQQGRQALGFSVPLALLTVLALSGPPSSRSRAQAGLPALPAATLAFSSSLLLALYTAITAGGVNDSYYAPAEVINAVTWLGHSAGPDDVVLASAGFGNLVPIQCSCRVVVGQNFETFHWAARQREVQEFYGAHTRAQAAQALHTLVLSEHVTYYVLSPYERAFGHTDLRALPGFHLCFRNQTTSIFTAVQGHG